MRNFLENLLAFSIGFIAVTIGYWLAGVDFNERSYEMGMWFFFSCITGFCTFVLHLIGKDLKK